MKKSGIALILVLIALIVVVVVVSTGQKDVNNDSFSQVRSLRLFQINELNQKIEIELSKNNENGSAVPEDVQELLDEAQKHINKASEVEPLLVNGELLKTKKALEKALDKLRNN